MSEYITWLHDLPFSVQAAMSAAHYINHDWIVEFFILHNLLHRKKRRQLDQWTIQPVKEISTRFHTFWIFSKRSLEVFQFSFQIEVDEPSWHHRITPESDWPWAWLIVITNAHRSGNCNRLESDAKSVESLVSLEFVALSLFSSPNIELFMIHYWIIFCRNLRFTWYNWQNMDELDIAIYHALSTTTDSLFIFPFFNSMVPF